jgi:phytoene dehydrogenase-like protein
MSGNEETFDAIVIGAGMGGASCAAVLAKRGQRVLLLERNAIAGGKAMTVRGGGFAYELWPVVSGPSVGSRFAELLAELDAEGEVELLTPDDVMEFIYRDGDERRHMVGAANPGGGDPLGMVTMLGLTDADIAEVLRMMGDLHGMDEQAMAALEGTTFSAWLDLYDLPQSVRSWFGVQANIIFVVPIDQLDAAEAIITLQDFAKGAAGRYHSGGYGSVAEVCAQRVAQYGGTVLYGADVEQIIVEGDHAVGVQLTDGRSFRAPVVVSNAGIQPTVLKLAGADHFDGDYVEQVRSLRPSWGIVGHRYVLTEPFFDRGAYFTFDDSNYMTTDRFAALSTGWLPDELSVFAVVPSQYDSSLAPEGSQMVLVGTFCDAGTELDYLPSMLERLDETMERVWPGFHKVVKSRVPYGTAQVSKVSRDAVVPGQGGECVGLAQIVGQCGTHKPSPRSPLAGLYLVGCDAGGRGCGTHQAVDSGLNVADLLS